MPKGRFQMHRILMCVFVVFAGCSFGIGRSTTTAVVDDGVRPVQRTTVTQSTSGASIGVSMPIMMGGGGGYGVVMNGPSCVLHPDRCAVIQTATVVQPMTIVSYGGGGGRVNTRVAQGDAGGDEYDAVHVDEFDELVKRVGNAIPQLKANSRLALRQSCYGIIKDPSIIEDADERKLKVASCKELLAKKPTPEVPADAGEEH